MSPSNAPVVRVDEQGIHFDGGFDGAGDVVFDDHRVWSFAVESATTQPGQPVTVPWPKTLKRRLDGHAVVRVVAGDREHFNGRVQFGEGTEPLSFVDKHGTPIIIDKWGLIQRTFEARRGSGVVEQMVGVCREILEVMRRDCGIEGWIAFGTLLGAARSGGVIGHDSDIDLCFLSEKQTPAEMAAEIWDIARALSRAGMQVQHKSGSFITVKFRAPDRSVSSIDIYTAFFLEGMLLETATVRAPMPRSAVLPLREIEFEGTMLPAPADVPAMLALSYGPGWQVPDPSFQHQPGPEIVRRFNGWFGSLMRQKRDWTHLNTRARSEQAAPSEFAAWVADQVDPDERVVDLGAGWGADVELYASRGLAASGLDYALPTGVRKRTASGARLGSLNLYDLRDVLTRGAGLARYPGRQVLTARGLLETLEPDGTRGLWQLVAMALRGGGRLFVESEALSPADAVVRTAELGGGRVRSLSPVLVEDAVRRAGGTVVWREAVADAARAVRGGRPTTWRMVAEWPDRSLPADAAGSMTTETTEATR